MKKLFILALLSFCLSTLPAVAGDHMKNIQFSHKQPSVSLQGAAVRGDRDIYLLNAQKGHCLMVKFSSLENNGALEVAAMANGKPIGGTVEQSEGGFTWISELPVTGAYKIIVSPTRGNVNYNMEISVVE
ncbi:MAG: hypothetical protein Q4F00_13680 [bacterium]|nr:hypothetical protein [bacterium]